MIYNNKQLNNYYLIKIKRKFKIIIKMMKIKKNIKKIYNKICNNKITIKLSKMIIFFLKIKIKI